MKDTIDPWDRGEMSDGSYVAAYVGTVSDTAIKKMIFTHTRPDGSKTVYTLFQPNCSGGSWAGLGLGEVWWVHLGYPFSHLGKWKFKVIAQDATTETRAINISDFTYAPKPSNISWSQDGDNWRIEWDASVGPPSWYDSDYLGDYVVWLMNDICGVDDTLGVDWYDPVTNRVGVTLPLSWNGRGVGVVNGIASGGGYKELPSTKKNKYSKAFFWTSCPG